VIWAGIGSALVAAGIRHRTGLEAACGAVGSSMLIWAFAAPSPVLRDIVQVSSEDSFPASDPPSTW
jgi:hypothetical protein